MELKDAILSTLAEIEEEKKAEEVIDTIVYKNNNLETNESNKELKDDNNSKIQEKISTFKSPFSIEKESKEDEKNTEDKNIFVENIKSEQKNDDDNKDEQLFLENLRERLLVLFEGFQSPNNKNKTSAKIDLIINFLEYLLAMTDERLDKINRK
jgi:hypothetical protein